MVDRLQHALTLMHTLFCTQYLQANATAMQRVVTRMQDGALAAFLGIYPYASAGVQAAKFAYHLLYLLDVSAYHSPVMNAIGQRLVRLSGQELVSVCWLHPYSH